MNKRITMSVDLEREGRDLVALSSQRVRADPQAALDAADYTGAVVRSRRKNPWDFTGTAAVTHSDNHAFPPGGVAIVQAHVSDR